MASIWPIRWLNRSCTAKPARLQEHARSTNSYVRNAVQIMEHDIESPMLLPDIAAQAGLSQRHLDRLFRTHLGRSPKRHYLECRLRPTRSLVRQTDLPIYEATLASGFSSSSYLAKWYTQQFGQVPLEKRQSFAQATSTSLPRQDH
ncbi:helix-turn-helix domain-containing protein [Roseovarius albus]|uniref:helix-turn-helix domain-containing protein n=1 Tax=Roseovarius albus TaxID=1247867 RepID=UPI000A270760